MLVDCPAVEAHALAAVVLVLLVREVGENPVDLLIWQRLGVELGPLGAAASPVCRGLGLVLVLVNDLVVLVPL